LSFPKKSLVSRPSFEVVKEGRFKILFT